MEAIRTYLKDIENWYERSNSRNIIWDLCLLLEKTCRNCEYREFQEILCDKIINASIPFANEVRKQGKTPKATEQLKLLQDRFKECCLELKKMKHIIRHNKFLKRFGMVHNYK